MGTEHIPGANKDVREILLNWEDREKGTEESRCFLISRMNWAVQASATAWRKAEGKVKEAAERK